MESFLFDLTVILVGAAVLSFLAVLLKQPIIIAYIACGMLLGPSGMAWIKNFDFVEDISHLGITLLLFLAGLCLHPQKLIELFRKTAFVTLINCGASFLIAFLFALVFRFALADSVCIALALMFSSTILTVKLLPTTKLHQQRMGAVCISILIMQDLLAIAVLALIRCIGAPQGAVVSFLLLFLKLCVFIGILVLFDQLVLKRIMRKVDRFHEMLFVLGIAWCFGVASVSNALGLFYETGAFFAGVVLASHKISLFISEKLKPLRDFFLVLFFFSLGARIDFLVMRSIFLPACLLTGIFVFVKPFLFERCFILTGESADFSRETGARLGQLSEFSLLVVLLAYELGHMTGQASQLVQAVTILSFVISSYLVVLKYPTPIGTKEELIRD